MKIHRYVLQPIYNNILEFHDHSIFLRNSAELFANDLNLDPYIFCMRTEKLRITPLQTGLGLALISFLMFTVRLSMVVGILTNTLTVT